MVDGLRPAELLVSLERVSVVGVSGGSGDGVLSEVGSQDVLVPLVDEEELSLDLDGRVDGEASVGSLDGESVELLNSSEELSLAAGGDGFRDLGGDSPLLGGASLEVVGSEVSLLPDGSVLSGLGAEADGDSAETPGEAGVGGVEVILERDAEVGGGGMFVGGLESDLVVVLTADGDVGEGTDSGLPDLLSVDLEDQVRVVVPSTEEVHGSGELDGLVSGDLLELLGEGCVVGELGTGEDSVGGALSDELGSSGDLLIELPSEEGISGELLVGELVALSVGDLREGGEGGEDDEGTEKDNEGCSHAF